MSYAVGCALQAVEDQVEAELELVAKVVAGLQDVLDGECREVRVFGGGELCEEGLGEHRGLDSLVEGQIALLEREPVDVAVQSREGMRGQCGREAGSAKAAEDGVVMTERRWTG